MSNLLIAFLAALGASAWVYNKAHRRTGGNTQNALIVAVVMGVIVCIIMLTILSLVDDRLGK